MKKKIHPRVDSRVDKNGSFPRDPLRSSSLPPAKPLSKTSVHSHITLIGLSTKMKKAFQKLKSCSSMIPLGVKFQSWTKRNIRVYEAPVSPSLQPHMDQFCSSSFEGKKGIESNKSSNCPPAQPSNEQFAVLYATPNSRTDFEANNQQQSVLSLPVTSPTGHLLRSRTQNAKSALVATKAMWQQISQTENGKGGRFEKLVQSKHGIELAHKFSKLNHFPEATLFLCAVLSYKKQMQSRKISRKHQFQLFLNVVKKYIVVGSALEINISEQQRNELLHFGQGPTQLFGGLPSFENRLAVFDNVYGEIERLFWLNFSVRKTTFATSET